MLVYFNDREALNSFVKAWRDASDLADKAFGAILPPPKYKPRSGR